MALWCLFSASVLCLVTLSAFASSLPQHQNRHQYRGAVLPNNAHQSTQTSDINDFGTNTERIRECGNFNAYIKDCSYKHSCYATTTKGTGMRVRVYEGSSGVASCSIQSKTWYGRWSTQATYNYNCQAGCGTGSSSGMHCDVTGGVSSCYSASAGSFIKY